MSYSRVLALPARTAALGRTLAALGKELVKFVRLFRQSGTAETVRQARESPRDGAGETTRAASRSARPDRSGAAPPSPALASADLPPDARLAARMQAADAVVRLGASDAFWPRRPPRRRGRRRNAPRRSRPACGDLRVVRAQPHGVGELLDRRLRLAVPDLGPAAEQPCHRQVGVERERPLRAARRRRDVAGDDRPGRSRRVASATASSGPSSAARRARRRTSATSAAWSVAQPLALRCEKQRAAMP